MDPITQGALGAAAAQLKSPKHLIQATIVGALAGMAPDLDILIRSTNDPLLALEFHRHFTHSLLFIPLGALMFAGLFYSLLKRFLVLSFLNVFWWSLLGIATHGILDGCTSYGTQLFWPFSNARISFDIVSVVDPFFTFPLLALVIVSALKRSRRYAVIGLSWSCIYLFLGYVQRERAIIEGAELAVSRKHSEVIVSAKPSFANLLVWKTIYEYEGYFYVDAVRVGILNNQRWEGDRIEKLNIDRDFSWLDKRSQQALDIERFRWFSAGYIAVDSSDESRIIDIRYSLLPHKIRALWGIELKQSRSDDEHVSYYTEHKDSRSSMSQLIAMIKGDELITRNNEKSIK